MYLNEFQSGAHLKPALSDAEIAMQRDSLSASPLRHIQLSAGAGGILRQSKDLFRLASTMQFIRLDHGIEMVSRTPTHLIVDPTYRFEGGGHLVGRPVSETSSKNLFVDTFGLEARPLSCLLDEYFGQPSTVTCFRFPADNVQRAYPLKSLRAVASGVLYDTLKDAALRAELSDCVSEFQSPRLTRVTRLLVERVAFQNATDLSGTDWNYHITQVGHASFAMVSLTNLPHKDKPNECCLLLQGRIHTPPAGVGMLRLCNILPPKVWQLMAGMQCADLCLGELLRNGAINPWFTLPESKELPEIKVALNIPRTTPLQKTFVIGDDTFAVISPPAVPLMLNVFFEAGKQHRTQLENLLNPGPAIISASVPAQEVIQAANTRTPCTLSATDPQAPVIIGDAVHWASQRTTHIAVCNGERYCATDDPELFVRQDNISFDLGLNLRAVEGVERHLHRLASRVEGWRVPSGNSTAIVSVQQLNPVPEFTLSARLENATDFSSTRNRNRLRCDEFLLNQILGQKGLGTWQGQPSVTRFSSGFVQWEPFSVTVRLEPIVDPGTECVTLHAKDFLPANLRAALRRGFADLFAPGVTTAMPRTWVPFKINDWPKMLVSLSLGTSTCERDGFAPGPETFAYLPSAHRGTRLTISFRPASCNDDYESVHRYAKNQFLPWVMADESMREHLVERAEIVNRNPLGIFPSSWCARRAASADLLQDCRTMTRELLGLTSADAALFLALVREIKHSKISLMCLSEEYMLVLCPFVHNDREWHFKFDVSSSLEPEAEFTREGGPPILKLSAVLSNAMFQSFQRNYFSDSQNRLVRQFWMYNRPPEPESYTSYETSFSSSSSSSSSSVSTSSPELYISGGGE